MTSGLRSLAYSMALCNGKPVEKNETRALHRGQLSTGSFKIISSSKMSKEMYSNFSSRWRISRIGLELAFLPMQQIPTTTFGLISMASQRDRPETAEGDVLSTLFAVAWTGEERKNPFYMSISSQWYNNTLIYESPPVSIK